ncbi:SWIM zinc finger family protein [Agaribacter flavus]|uniref:SWIM zinc finger domain-containing protein n=1 Tax=Agaribacter flavus TaxID=1902781 RepID=A0ABV7FRS8_9ALTE
MSEIKSIIARLSGQAAFEKGQALFNKGAVTEYFFQNNEIRAKVQGGYLYDVALSVIGNSFDGGCTCPASEGFDVCKHCVAVLLHYEQQTTEFAKASDKAPLERIKAYITQLPTDQVRENLFSFICSNQDTIEQWTMLADIAFDQFDKKAFKKEITKTLPIKDIWKHDQVRDYFTKARTRLTMQLEIINSLDPSAAIELLIYYIERYDKVNSRIDDTAGFRLSVYYLLEKALLKAFATVTWSDDQKVLFLLSLTETEYLSVDFGDVGKRFIQLNDDKLKAAYYNSLADLVDQDLRKKLLGAREFNKSKFESRLNSLVTYYLDTKKLTKALELKSSIASSVDDFKQIITECFEIKNYELAKACISSAHKYAKHTHEKGLLDKFTLQLAVAEGDQEKAIKVAWALYKSSYNIDDFIALRSLYTKASMPISDLVTRAEQMLLKQTNDSKPSRASKDIESLVALYIETKQLEKAFDIAQNVELRENLLHTICLQCISSELPEQALVLYKKLIHHHAAKGRNHGYQRCIDLMLELEEKRDMLPRGAEEVQRIYQELMSLYGSKLNFIQLLQLNFGEL